MKVPPHQDPLGRRALFSPSPAEASNGSRGGAPATAVDEREPPGADDVRAPGSGAAGKRALFSEPPPRPATVLMDCSSCRARTRVGYLDFALRHLPFWLWVPGRRYSRLLSCPACGRRTWVAVRFRG